MWYEKIVLFDIFKCNKIKKKVRKKNIKFTENDDPSIHENKNIIKKK